MCRAIPPRWHAMPPCWSAKVTHSAPPAYSTCSRTPTTSKPGHGLNGRWKRSKKQPAPAITAARQPTWRCAVIPTLSGCRPWCRLPITFRFSPLPRKRGRAVETHQKASCTWFFNVQAAFSDSVHERGAGCFLCVMWLMRRTFDAAATCSLSRGRGLG